MTHIHIPDGVLPVWLWLGGWVATLAVLWLAGRASSAAEARRRVPLLAVVSAVMLVAMSSEVVPLAYHLNLTVIAGTLLGTALCPIAAFIVCVILALLGHGGVTVIGLNTLLITAEMVVGGALFRGLIAALGRKRVPAAAAIATVVTLALTTALLVGVVALAGTSQATSRETGALDPASLRFSNPLTSGVFKLGLFAGGETPPPVTAESEPTGFSVKRFAAVVFVLGPIGWLLEAFVSALVLGYVARVRPSLIWAPVVRQPRALADGSGLH
jgi:cobalt/nickel transport system permease protein